MSFDGCMYVCIYNVCVCGRGGGDGARSEGEFSYGGHQLYARAVTLHTTRMNILSRRSLVCFCQMENRFKLMLNKTVPRDVGFGLVFI